MMLMQTSKQAWRMVLLIISILLLISNFPALFRSRSTCTFETSKAGSYHQQGPEVGSDTKGHSKDGAESTSKPVTSSLSNEISLPAVYTDRIVSETPWCQDRFSTQYLFNLAHSQLEYCNQSSSQGSMYCYTTRVAEDYVIDPFCVTSPAVFDPTDKKFVLDCSMRLAIQHPISSFPLYWYFTGPRSLMERYLDLSPDRKVVDVTFERKFIILVRREDPVGNLWHVLMQIQSVFLTLDVMSMTFDSKRTAMYTSEDVQNTQVVFTDKLNDALFSSLWQMLGGRPISHISRLSANSDLASGRLIFPLAGKSNPMWQSDWLPHACGRSVVLQTFSKRVLQHHGMEGSVQKSNDSPLVLTWIDRRETRRLVGQEQHLQLLQEQYPNVILDVVDFAALSTVDQLKIIQNTDILAGVHGAGLANGIFLPAGTVLVEIQPPRLEHRGFRNMARLAGLQYFVTDAEDLQDGNDWQDSDVIIGSDKLIRTMGAAINAMSQRGLRTDNIA